MKENKNLTIIMLKILKAHKGDRITMRHKPSISCNYSRGLINPLFTLIIQFYWLILSKIN